jgi:transcriptional regulator with XRE-family HTH domain
MLGWSREELSSRSRVSMATLADFEAGKRTPYERTLVDVRAALQAGGIEFIPENGGGAGVRLKK